MVRKTACLRKFLKLCVATLCTFGFLFQTLEFLNLYWTYPTVVDIQVSVPSEIDMPGISFCNANGIYPEAICKLKGKCTHHQMLKYFDICVVAPFYCYPNGSLPTDYRGVSYNNFMKSNRLNATSLSTIRKPISEFLKCKIVSSSQERDCKLDDAIIGSYYSESYMPNFCFSINTLWSQPNKKIEKIKKSERIKLEFYMNLVDRLKEPPMDEPVLPKFNYPSSPTVQLLVHSPFLSPSPYLSGQTFEGGKKYEIKLKQVEKHLLPPPYVTNCTQYMPMWQSRGGVGPLNQLMVLQECKLNASQERHGCIPLTIDYPHNLDICKYCDNCTDSENIWDHCTDLLDRYNQPCNFATYEMKVEQKVILLRKDYRNNLAKFTETVYFQAMGYNCTYDNILTTRRCQTVEIELSFDDFEITNMTYNAKFESLELFSVIGGYMGMYLGVSIVAMYDFAEVLIIAAYNFMKKDKAKKKQKMFSEKALRKSRPSSFGSRRGFRKRTSVRMFREKF